MTREGLENPELAEDPEVVNISVGKKSMSKLERPAAKSFMKQDAHERVLKMREETERMEKEFLEVEGALQILKEKKDEAWYDDQLQQDYGNLSNHQMITRMTNIKSEIAYRTQEGIVQAMRDAMGVFPSKDMKRDKFVLDKKNQRLAEKDPLQFIEAVLASHPQ